MLRVMALLAGLGGLAAFGTGAGLLLGAEPMPAGLSCRAFCGLGLLAETLDLVGDARSVSGVLLACVGLASCWLGAKLWRG